MTLSKRLTNPIQTTIKKKSKCYSCRRILYNYHITIINILLNKDVDKNKQIT